MINFKSSIDKCINSKYRISEQVIEEGCIGYLLNNLGFNYNENIKTEDDLKNNFRLNIERLNNIKLSDQQFNAWWIEFNSGNFFERYKRLHTDQKQIKDKDVLVKTLKFFDFNNVKNNNFEIVNQMWVKGKDKERRFDINILINGIPIVHIELKKEDVNVKEAIKQIIRYKKDDAIKSLLDYTHIFISSNFTETYYFSNNNKINERFHFKWSNDNNEAPKNLFDFCDQFLKKEILLDIINKYYACDTEKQIVKICRPYQYHAIKKVIEKITNNNLNNREKSGYIWHATGSGKTLTSFKVCENITHLNEIDNIVFLVDRKDLNNQSKSDFESFTTKSNLVYDALNSQKLYELLTDENYKHKIIISTIQKLNKVLDPKKYPKINNIKNNKIVFVVDECHRSQLGIMRDKINHFFVNSINYAFTGTPIFDINAGVEGKTTENIFGKEIHRYTSFNAINDGNVLPLTFTHVESIASQNLENGFDDDIDEDKDINKKVDMGYINNVANYIKEKFSRVTDNGRFNAMLATASIPEAMAYYNTFKKLTNLKVGIVFSISDSLGTDMKIKKDISDFYLSVIKEYNSSWGLDSQEQYKNQVVHNFKEHENNKIDLLIVVSMLLTGFDSPKTNTLFLDKSLRYQGLVQAVSRTNRVLDSYKKNGQIISFRTSEEAVNQAFDLYTNGGTNTPYNGKLWRCEKYENIREDFIKCIDSFYKEFNNSEELSNLVKEENKIQYMNSFKKLQEIYTKIHVMVDFTWDEFKMSERDYKKFYGKYKELVEQMRNGEIVYVYNDYELIELNTYTIDANFLSSLLKNIKYYDGELPDVIDDSFYVYKDLKDDINSKFSSELEKEIVLEFIKNREVYQTNNIKELSVIWSKYIDELIKRTTDSASIKWKCNVNAINKLIQCYEYKKVISKDEANEILPEYIDDILMCDEKIRDVEKTIKKLIILDGIKEIYLNNI